MKKIYIIGAGPGDPDLITVKGKRLLESAEVILYADSLIPDSFFRGIDTKAELITTANLHLDEIINTAAEAVNNNKVVVRLHDGDLSLYSTVAEQIREFTVLGIECELVPGVGAYQAAAAKLQVELTLPELVQTIVISRASGQASAMPAAEELSLLAAHRASLCLYLSAKRIREAREKLLQHYPPETPVAICYRVSWEDERIWLVNLSEVADVSERENLSRTTLYIISPALAGFAGSRSCLYDLRYDRIFKPGDRA